MFLSFESCLKMLMDELRSSSQVHGPLLYGVLSVVCWVTANLEVRNHLLILGFSGHQIFSKRPLTYGLKFCHVTLVSHSWRLGSSFACRRCRVSVSSPTSDTNWQSIPLILFYALDQWMSTQPMDIPWWVGVWRDGEGCLKDATEDGSKAFMYERAELDLWLSLKSENLQPPLELRSRRKTKDEAAAWQRNRPERLP